MPRSLYLGYTGDDVLQAQKDLQSIGFYVGGPLDGIFGPFMDTEVRRLQLENGMAGDGWYGPNTRAVVAAKQKQASKRTVKKPKKKKKKSSSTHKMARWHGFVFLVSPNVIRSFTDLQVETSCETENKKDSEQGLVSRKGANPSEVSFKVHYNAYTGCNVRTETYDLMMAAQNGVSDYLYIGSQKIITYQFMLVKATLQNVEMTPKGKWISAELLLTMKQCTWN